MAKVKTSSKKVKACFEAAMDITDAEAAEIALAADEYIDYGQKPSDAYRTAIIDKIDALQADYDAVRAEIKRVREGQKAKEEPLKIREPIATEEVEVEEELTPREGKPGTELADLEDVIEAAENEKSRTKYQRLLADIMGFKKSNDLTVVQKAVAFLKSLPVDEDYMRAQNILQKRLELAEYNKEREGEIAKFRATPVQRFAQLVKDTLEGVYRSKEDKAELVESITSILKGITPDDMDATVRFGRLRDYFTAKGIPKIYRAQGMWKLGTRIPTADEIKDIERLQREAGEQAKSDMAKKMEQITGDMNIPREKSKPQVEVTTDEEGTTIEANEVIKDFDANADEGRFFSDDNTPINKSIPHGRIKILVDGFMRKLARSPKFHIYKNQADLKARNPELYKRAVAARGASKDFDSATAAAYYMGGAEPTVIVFSDRIVTEQQLRFILAHETIGHYGLRGLIPKSEFDALMREIYDNVPSLQGDVDAAMFSRGMNKEEAVEEYLADFAAQLDSSLLFRIWTAIKNALNKLGIKFGDEMARYLVSQSRKYVRSGQSNSMFNTAKVMRELFAMETGQDIHNTGRYAAAPSFHVMNVLAGGQFGMETVVPASYEETKTFIQDRLSRYGYKLDRFLNRFWGLTNFRARENAGLSAVNNVLNGGVNMAMRIKVYTNEMLAPVLNRALATATKDAKFLGGISDDERKEVSRMLYEGQRYAVSKLKNLKALGDAPLFTIDERGEPVETSEVERIYKMGLLTFEQMRDGFEYKVTYEHEGKPKTDTIKVDGIKGLTKDDIRWRGYLLVRQAIRYVELELLKARYKSYMKDTDVAYKEIAELMRSKELSDQDRKLLSRAYNKYRELWMKDAEEAEDGSQIINADSADLANDFIEKFNTAIIANEPAATDKKAKERNDELAKFFADDPKLAAQVISEVEEFKKNRERLEGLDRFRIQNKLKDIIMAELAHVQGDLFTKRTLAYGYTPIKRRGQFDVRVVAYNKNGEVVRLQEEYKEQLSYSQVENIDEAKNLAASINKTIFNDKDGKPYTVKVMAYDPETSTYKLTEVRLAAQPGVARDAVSAPPDLNLNEFLMGLRRFNMPVHPAKMKEIILALTKQNNKARDRLKRVFAPGADPDAIKAISEHIDGRASTIAKVMMRPHLHELMNDTLSASNKLWFGDDKKLAQLKREWQAAEKDPNVSDEVKLARKREYDRYAFQQNKLVEGGVRQGLKYYNEASRLLAFLDNNKNIDESDFGAGELASSVRAVTSIVQLGASLATGVLNIVSAYTNSLPYLATYNEKNGFGGGFGLGRSLSAMMEAQSAVGLTRAMGNAKMNTSQFYADMANNPQMLKEYGLQAHEARFLAREILEGKMIPAQSNALMNTAYGRMTTSAQQKFTESWMWTFNVTEQAVRRSVGLAAYRMAYIRAKASEMHKNLAAGMSKAEAEKAAELAAVERARSFAVSALDYTLGSYNVLNRPAAWRSGVQSFMYMYKIYPTTMIQLLSRLPLDGKIMMLASLWLLAGVMGWPFAKDIEDLVDTLAQALGLRVGSVRYEIAKKLDELMPGLGSIAMNGLGNKFFPGDVASRTDLGNFVPGSGALLAGADVGRELIDIGGPAVAMLMGVGSTATQSVRFLAGSETVTLQDIFRGAPVTMLRAIGDTWAYTQAGAVVDKRGFIVSPDASMLMLATRLMGFYPASAAEQFEVIRLSKRMDLYKKEVSKSYQQSWVEAMIQNDRGRARNIEDAVDSWNEATKGTALEIRNFRKNAQKAYEEGKRPAKERYLRAAPKAARDDLEHVADILSY